MLVYLAVIVGILLFVFLLKLTFPYRNTDHLFIYGSFIILILISCLRQNTVGGDLFNYLPLFEEASTTSFYEYLNMPKYGFIFLFYNKLLSWIGNKEIIYMVGTSVFNLLSVAIFIKRYSKIPWISVLLYITLGFYTNTFNSIRSSMALAIILYSVPYILNRQFVKFLFIYICAFIVHKSVFPFILLYFIAQKEISLKKLFLISIVIFFLVSQVSDIMNLILILYNPFYEAEELSGGGYFYFLFLLIMLMFCRYFTSSKDFQERFFFNFVALGLCIQPAASCISYINRITIFFSIALIIAVPNAFSCIRNSKLKMIAGLSLIIFCFLYFIKITMRIDPELDNNSQGTLFYMFNWE